MVEHPSLLSGCASTRVYVHRAAEILIFLRSYLGFSYEHTDSDESIYDTSIIKVVDVPCRNSPYYVAYTHTWIFEPSVCLSGCVLKEIGKLGVKIVSGEGNMIVITPEEFQSFWRRVNEFTLSSMSGVHYGHYKAVIQDEVSTKVLAQQLTVIT
jgi:hypothetical protein